MDFSEQYLHYKHLVNEQLRTTVDARSPASLYEPTRYVLDAGGKRIRAVLVMLASEVVGGTALAALGAGVGVEILHNFTLVHDDIMDRAATRRGRATVHTRWDESTAILVGDVMIGLAHQALLASEPPRLAEAFDAFTRGLVDVCEGQALDRDFETRSGVTLDDYLHMIAMKTGRLVETAAEVGGLVGDGSPEEIDALRSYARHIGQAFQIQDDLLDIMAEEAELGKRIGGDVIEGKKTYLFVKADARIADGEDRALLDSFLANKGLPPERVDAMRDLYARCGVLEEARDDVRRGIEAATADLEALRDTPARATLVRFAHELMDRTN